MTTQYVKFQKIEIDGDALADELEKIHSKTDPDKEWEMYCI